MFCSQILNLFCFVFADFYFMICSTLRCCRLISERRRRKPQRPRQQPPNRENVARALEDGSGCCNLYHSLSLSLSLSHSLTHTHTHFRSLSFSLSLSHTHKHTHSFFISLSLCPTYTFTHTRMYAPTYLISISLLSFKYCTYIVFSLPLLIIL